jgi:hypothetical protein
MQRRERMFDDLAKVANGAVSTLVGIKAELEALVRQQMERFLAGMDVVPRDEFDAVKAMATKARSEQEALERRVAELEAALGGGPKSRPARSRKKASPKSPS